MTGNYFWNPSLKRVTERYLFISKENALPGIGTILKNSVIRLKTFSIQLCYVPLRHYIRIIHCIPDKDYICCQHHRIVQLLRNRLYYNRKVLYATNNLGIRSLGTYKQPCLQVIKIEQLLFEA